MLLPRYTNHTQASNLYAWCSPLMKGGGKHFLEPTQFSWSSRFFLWLQENCQQLDHGFVKTCGFRLGYKNNYFLYKGVGPSHICILKYKWFIYFLYFKIRNKIYNKRTLATFFWWKRHFLAPLLSHFNWGRKWNIGHLLLHHNSSRFFCIKIFQGLVLVGAFPKDWYIYYYY